MFSLARFLTQLFTTGDIVFERPSVEEEEDKALCLLASRHSEEILGLAGPPVPFDQATAWAAATLVRDACWYLVSHEDPGSIVTQRLRMPGPPQGAEAHLAADLVFRYLPDLYRRARARDPEDPLTLGLGLLAQEWPLSGVLVDLDGAPLGDLTFGNHLGLQLLFAERLAMSQRVGWEPQGRAGEILDLVLQEQGAKRGPGSRHE